MFFFSAMCLKGDFVEVCTRSTDVAPFSLLLCWNWSWPEVWAGSWGLCSFEKRVLVDSILSDICSTVVCCDAGACDDMTVIMLTMVPAVTVDVHGSWSVFRDFPAIATSREKSCCSGNGWMFGDDDVAGHGFNKA